MTWFSKWYVAWSLSGAFLGIGFVVPVLWIVGVIGGAYFIYLLQQTGPWRQKFWGAWLAWTIKAAFSMGWLWSTYPIEWLPLDIGQVQLALIGLCWFLIAVSLGSGAFLLVLVAWFLQKLTTLPTAAYYFLVYPLLWVIGESLGSLMFSIVFYGPGGAITSAFSFGYVGYLLAQHQTLLQAAQLAGVFGLSIIFVWLAAAVAWSAGQRRRVVYVAAAGLVVLFLTSTLTPVKTSEIPFSESYEVVTIDTRLGSRLQNSHIGQLQRRAALEAATQAALTAKPDYIILPEDSSYFDQSLPPSSIRSLFALQQEDPQVVIVDSGRASYEGMTVLQAFIYNGPDNSYERSHKRYLVPLGEFLSYSYIFLVKSISSSESYEQLAQGISYRVGPLASQSGGAANLPGILYCFESFAPHGVKLLASERPEMPFVAHIASHAWFHEPQTMWSQMESMLRVQAVWNQRHIISAGNMVSGKWYTPDGAVKELEVIERGENWELKRAFIPR